MSGSAAAETVLFIGALMAALAFVGIFTATTQEFGQALRLRGDLGSDTLRSRITIINDPQEVDVSPDPIIYAKNTGAVDLLSVDVDVLLDGQVSGNVSYDVLDSSDDERWSVGRTIELTVQDLNAAAGAHRVRVVTGTGASDTLEFTV